MKRLDFSVFGDPKGQPRARACIRGRHAGMYDPGTADAWKFAVRAAAIEAAGKGWTPIEGPVRLKLMFWFRRPKAHFNSKGEKKDSAPVWSVGKPDLDNLAKAVMDALTNAGVWLDDKQVASLEIEKLYGPTTGGAHVVVKELIPSHPPAPNPEYARTSRNAKRRASQSTASRWNQTR